MTFQNLNEYVGEFENDLMNGTGVYTYKSGEVYEGNFKDGKKFGKFGLCTGY